MTFQDGDIVEISYVGRVKGTGEIFDLTDPDVAEEEDIDTSDMELGPVKVLLGEGYVLEGLEEKVKEMDVDEERTVEVPKAFGSRKSENIKTVPKREFDEHDVRPRRGMPVEVDGRRGTIMSVSSGRVKVDFNHPLAGKDVEYDVEVLRKIDDPGEQVQAIAEFHVGHDFDVTFEDGTATVMIHADVPEEARDKLAEEIEKLEAVNEAVVEAEEDEGAA